MDTKQKFNRQVYDFLLTDLLPYEKGNHYTHIYVYKFLLENKSAVNKIVKDMKSQNTQFNATWHSAPSNFKVSKSQNGFRTLSLINPLGLIGSLVFLEIFESDILGIIDNKYDFSARKPSKTNSLSYKKSNNSTVYYSDDQYKKQLLISLESKGTYFRHYPSKTITGLLNSNQFIYALDKYSYLLKLDIQNFFPNIYTHSFKWLISNKSYDSKTLNNSSSVYRNIDALLTNLNSSKTNGIIVGPEFSRLLADFLLIHLDEKLYGTLLDKDLLNQTDYVIYRFVDDYFIFTQSKHHQDIIYSKVENLLNKYHLKINESKIESYQNDYMLNSWVSKVQTLIDEINIPSDEPDYKTHLEELKDHPEIEVMKEIAYTLLELNESKDDKKYLNLRRDLDLIITETDEKIFVSSYVLSTLLSKIEAKGEKGLRIKKRDLINFIFYTYTKNVTYSSSQKVVRALSLLLEENFENKRIIENCVERFQKDIFEGNFISEWIDLLFLFSSYDIQISNTLINNITNKIMVEKTPIHIAGLSLFYESKIYKSTDFHKSLNKLILNKFKKINWDSFFEDELSWWVFIYFSYPNLCQRLKEMMKVKLEDLRREVAHSQSQSPAGQAKLLIIKFLLKETNHFIEWNFTKENYHKKFYFYTRDRTVFFPDIIDELNVSR